MTLPLTYDLDLQSLANYGHDLLYWHVKVQSQRSIGSEDRVETTGRTDGGDCNTSQANAVGKILAVRVLLHTSNAVNQVIKYKQCARVITRPVKFVCVYITV